MLYRSHIDHVVLGMRAEPFDLDCPIFEDNPGDKAVFVAHDIEDHAVVGHDACVPIHLFQLVEIPEIAVQQLMVPFQQRSYGDDVEYGCNVTKSLPMGNLIRCYPVGVCFDFRPVP